MFTRSSSSNNSGSQTVNNMKPFNSKTPATITENSPQDVSRERPVEDTVMYETLTSGSGIWENTEDMHWDSSTAPQPRSRSWGGHTGWSPTILSPSFSLQPPCPLSPSLPLPLPLFFCLSACLPACTGAVYRTGPQWPRVINCYYDADGFLPSTFVCCFAPLCLFPFSYTTAGTQRHTGGHHCRRLKTAPLQWRGPTLPLGYIN